MSDQPQQASRFTPQNQITHERLSTHTVGLVALSDFRKRRAEVLEQQEREAREAALAAARTSSTSTPDRSLTATPNNASDNNNNNNNNGEAERAKKKKKTAKRVKALVSFGDEEDGEEEGGGSDSAAAGRAGEGSRTKQGEKGKDAGSKNGSSSSSSSGSNDAGDAAAGTDSASGDDKGGGKPLAKVAVNASVGIVPRALTKAALRREAAEREALRKEFLQLQAAVKATEIAIPFVFYDGTNIPGGTVRVKKGDFVWLFLDKSRKVGAQLGVGAGKSTNVRRDYWARISVDDLLLVRGTIIIPHHYDFYFFIINKTIGPSNRLLFDYSAEAPPPAGSGAASGLDQPGGTKGLASLSELEGASDDPTFTKVVDRRWYQRNKHIYPASVWQEFDPEKDYSKEIPRDTGGNAFFFSR